MSKISQDLARKLATILLEKKQKEVNLLEEISKDLLETEYLKTVPKAIIEFAEKNPTWVKKSNSFQLVGNGFGYKYAYTKNKLPAEKNDCTPVFEPNPKVAEKLKTAMNKAEAAEKNIKTVRSELVSTLLSLGTAKRIVEAFPELANHMEQPVMALTVDVTGIKKKINALP